jgi:hypothetical protein
VVISQKLTGQLGHAGQPINTGLQQPHDVPQLKNYGTNATFLFATPDFISKHINSRCSYPLDAWFMRR